jgi:hypothetical protein
MKGFTEVSANYTDWYRNYEVFLHLNSEGKIIRGYTWSDDAPVSMKTEKPIKLKKGTNPLFGYLSKKWLESNQLSITLEGNEEIEEILFKCSNLYPKVIIE